MKHLHLFENKGDKYWIVVYECLEDSIGNFVALFDDKESTENYYVDLVNDIKANLEYRKRRSEITEDEMIVTVEEAENYLSDNTEYNVNYGEIESKGKFELPEKLQIIKNSRKYNI